MPTDAELSFYAASLPPIYKDILAAYPAVEPGRRGGDGLAFQTLAIHFVNEGIAYGFGEVREAGEQLAQSGLIEIKHGMFAHPTPLGEKLIGLISGKPASERRVPPLPALPR
ncbi:MAG: hypothetical protein K2W96_22075 [Gemmataceae bacterium]|nr:hypothetical protein [Gemmataceae bacterium]